MSGSLVTPWSGSTVAVRPQPVVSLTALAAPVGGRSGSAAGWSLLTPWSATRLAPPALPVVTGLPTLAPTLPVPRPAGDEAVPALV